MRVGIFLAAVLATVVVVRAEFNCTEVIAEDLVYFSDEDDAAVIQLSDVINLSQPGCTDPMAVFRYQYLTGPDPDTGLLVMFKPNGFFDYRPPENFFGNVTFTYQLNATSGGIVRETSAAATITVVIRPMQDCPEVTTPTLQMTPQGVPVSINLTFFVNDPDGDPLEFIFIPLSNVSMFPIDSLNGETDLDPNTGIAIFRPDPLQAGMGFEGGAFAFSVSDGICQTSPAFQLITLLPVPIAQNKTVMGPPGQPIEDSLDVFVTGPEPGSSVQSHSIVVDVPVPDGTLILDQISGNFTFVPAHGGVISTEFKFDATNFDGRTSNVGTVSIRITTETVTNTQSPSTSQSDPQSQTQSPSQSDAPTQSASPSESQETQQSMSDAPGGGGSGDGIGTAGIVGISIGGLVVLVGLVIVGCVLMRS